jgi:hypothetical protein
MDRGTGDGYRVQGQVTDGLREALSAGGVYAVFPPFLRPGSNWLNLPFRHPLAALLPVWQVHRRRRGPGAIQPDGDPKNARKVSVW